MTILRSHTNAWRYANLEPTTGNIHILPFWRTVGWRRKKVSGWYASLGTSLVAVFVTPNGIQLRLPGVLIPFDGRVQVEHQASASKRTIRIVQGSNMLLEAEYQQHISQAALERDMTAGIDGEQFDFGLFLFNLSNNPSRLEQLRQALD